jgi:hypothetical protein
MCGDRRVSLTRFVDDEKTSPFRYGMVMQCVLVMIFDGFETQAINYLGPARELRLLR